jgi:hypothetical protein
MKKAVIVLASAGVLAGGVVAPVALGSGSAGPRVTVRIRTLTKTLKNVVVRGEKGSITKGGTPRGKCPGDSAAGALDAATHGRWTGSYSKSVGGIFITSILGVRPHGEDFWSIFVNGKSATKGACELKLRPQEKLLFKIVK